MPSVERILKTFRPLKEYFLSIGNNCPTIIRTFFETPCGEAWLWFVHQNSAACHEAILKVEGNSICATDAVVIYFDLLEKVEETGNGRIFTFASSS